MPVLNQRDPVTLPETKGQPSPRRKCHLLVEFPHPELESVIVQWEGYRPTVLVQLKRNAHEPLQFYGLRTDVPAYADMPRSYPPELDGKLRNFLDPATGKPFTGHAYLADIVFSARAFTHLQPEPDLVLPPQSLWECRTEALEALHLADEPLKPKVPL